ncbi:SIR2 family protein [Undibacterium sp. TS12]|uniref:SIR2 family protein n=1 Tax=Undibacterium sp. TS12 TaxID=2908202 RepID=UPI001F4C7961|nr:SIR2 family protein [Undibacterium sp. TS12]MCH8619726.1 SIR2 family protein [Undibacterium sp. TS12]
MKFLYDEFFDDLSGNENLRVENGQVAIRHRTWTPKEILELAELTDGSNPILEEVFDSWFEDRLALKCESAEDFLREYELEERFLKLSEMFKKGSVVPFVGAGMSIPCGYPGWTNFLRQQRKQTLLDEAEFERMLSSGLYEEAAQALCDNLNEGFHEVFNNAFGSERQLSGPVRMLPYIFKKNVITTNFDSVVERAYKEANFAFTEKIIGYDADDIRVQLGKRERFLLLAHGKASSPKGRVLTKSEYVQHYGESGGVASSIDAICAQTTLLFIGCSLSVDRTLTEMQAFAKKLGHHNVPAHYAFLSMPVDERGEPDQVARVRRQRELAACNIFPIWYPAGNHNDAIEALLLKLFSS